MKKKLFKKENNPARIILISFFLVILAGSFLLKLPQCSNKEISYIDALYTSTSAVCVTGLIVLDTPKDFTIFGQFVIMCLIQAGGLGIMTFSLLIIVFFSKKLKLKDTVIASQITGETRLDNISKIVKYVIIFTFISELIGFLLLLIKFIGIPHIPVKHAIFHSIFHSVSAFCNAGFSTFSDSLMQYKNDLWINMVIISLITLGGIGFVVIINIHNFFLKTDTKIKKKLSVHTKLTLLTSGFLIAAGTFAFFIFEYNNVLKELSTANKLLTSLFQSVTCRTAGFNTIDVSQLTPASLLTSIVLMFIGGSPSSTAGGIKTTTFAILIITLYSMIKEKNNVEIYRKKIPKTLVNKSISIITISFIVIIAVTTLAFYTEANFPTSENSNFIKYLFETVSALGTVGLSMGITPGLSFSAKILYILVMFVGRLGPLTFAIAIAHKEEKINYMFPEEKVLIG